MEQIVQSYLYSVAAGAAAFAFVFSLCFVSRRLAWRIGAVDYPGEARRVHRRPTPRTGGIAVYLEFLLGSALFCPLSPLLAAVWTGACLLFLTGLVDDTVSLGVGLRFAAQSVAALIVILGAGLADFSDPLSFFLSFVFLVALTNAHNFIDGIDGLCAKTAAAEALAVGLLLYLAGSPGDALAMLILGCALLGFLPHGNPPARLFLGDCGSTCAGFLPGCFALRFVGLSRQADSPPSPSVLLLVLVFVFSLPLSDLFLAVLRRLTEMKNPFLPDRHHLHHILIDSGFSHADAAAILVTLCALSALIGVCMTVDALLPFASLGCIAAACMLIWVRRRMALRRTAVHLHRLSEPGGHGERLPGKTG